MLNIKDKEEKLYQRVFTSCFLLTISGFVAYKVPQVVDLIGMVGGILVTCIAITLPGMCYYKLKGPYKEVVLFFTVLLTMVGFTASILSLLDTMGVIHTGA